MPLSHDNDMLLDITRVSAPFYLGARQPVTVYRARKRTQPVGAVIPVFAADGFNGSMDLLVGIAYDGSVTGVRVTEHNETAGFGDVIHQERSDWLAAFVGRSLDNPGAAGWDLKSANGSFDDVSGATISAAAVVKAVSRSLQLYRENRRRLYQPPRPVE
jgi:electron transport complex protein RnfG